jgi:hypothetical protein
MVNMNPIIVSMDLIMARRLMKMIIQWKNKCPMKIYKQEIYYSLRSSY